MAEEQQQDDQQKDDSGAKVSDLEARVAELTNKVAEFRTNNTTLAQQIEALKSEKDEASQTAEKATGEAKTMAERIAALESANERAQQEADAARKEARRTTLTNKLQAAGVAAGVQRNAVDRFAQVHLDSLDLTESGGIVVKGENGPRLSTDPKRAGEPMLLSEYIGDVLQSEPFWTAGSSGDGAGGDGHGGNPGAQRTITREQFASADKDTLDKIGKGEIVVSVE